MKELNDEFYYKKKIINMILKIFKINNIHFYSKIKLLYFI